MGENQKNGAMVGTGGEEALSPAVRGLVEEAVEEAESFTISIEEEPPRSRKLPLQGTAGAAVGTVKNAAGAATSTSRSMAGGAVNGGQAAAAKLVALAAAALDFVQEENVIDRTVDFLHEAENEGKRFVNDVSSFVGQLRP